MFKPTLLDDVVEVAPRPVITRTLPAGTVYGVPSLICTMSRGSGRYWTLTVRALSGGVCDIEIRMRTPKMRPRTSEAGWIEIRFMGVSWEGARGRWRS